MKWTEKEIGYLKENYPQRIKIKVLMDKLNRSRRAIQHKASRLEISRKRFVFDKPKQSRKVIEKRYYEKHKKELYRNKKKRVNERTKEFKKRLGGECSKCGYKKCLPALEFHHNSGDKEGNVSHLIKDFSKQKALKEIKKCILLCANCHREVHLG
jgi:hypothetical protein